MKKILVVQLLALLSVFALNAQSPAKTGAEYFAGKWNVLIRSTPNGDIRMVFAFENKDSKFTGVVQDTSGMELFILTSVELKENEVTSYFSAEGYDISVTLVKKDEDNVTGNMMAMFDVEGVRKKEKDQ